MTNDFYTLTCKFTTVPCFSLTTFSLNCLQTVCRRIPCIHFIRLVMWYLNFNANHLNAIPKIFISTTFEICVVWISYTVYELFRFVLHSIYTAIVRGVSVYKPITCWYDKERNQYTRISHIEHEGSEICREHSESLLIRNRHKWLALKKQTTHQHSWQNNSRIEFHALAIFNIWYLSLQLYPFMDAQQMIHTQDSLSQMHTQTEWRKKVHNKALRSSHTFHLQFLCPYHKHVRIACFIQYWHILIATNVSSVNENDDEDRIMNRTNNSFFLSRHFCGNKNKTFYALQYADNRRNQEKSINSTIFPFHLFL